MGESWYDIAGDRNWYGEESWRLKLPDILIA
jgi:hypothetical protein